MNIQRVAVIGAGVMGAGIAAQIANAGVAVDLLDIVPKDNTNRNLIAESALAKLLKTEPAAFMHTKNARLISPGNIEDHLDRLAQVDWVIEAVIENPEIKQALYQKLEHACRQDALISSNTSTIPLSVLTHKLSGDFQRRFMITHFFNPPRYMRLLELVVPAEFNQDLLATITEFAETHLGKGCVLCHDTPGFIANRIGTFWMQTALCEAIALQLTVEQCDAVMTLFGIPKTGVFGLLDLVGIDLLPHILASFKANLSPNDRLQAISQVPPLLHNMIAQGLIGRKGKGGFYRLQPGVGHKVKESIDLQTGEYRLSESFQIKGVGQQSADLQTFLMGTEPLNQFAWKVFLATFAYTAGLIPEISEDIVAVDSAMRLGYNWRYGPFELLDRLGVSWFVDKFAQAGQKVPALLSDRHSLYQTDNGVLQFKNRSNAYQPIQRPKGVLLLSDIKRDKPALLENNSASLWDLGDGIACLEFHSKMNTLDLENLELTRQSVAKIILDFKGLVIYNEADNFSAGANLNLLVPAIIQHDWAAVERIVKVGQETYQALKFAPFPVVGAPSGLALGGGCEILLHCDAIQAHAECYMGLVEVGVGLIPAWGGCKEFLRRWQAFPKRPGGPLPPIAQTFEIIGLAKVSKSAQEAKEMLFLSSKDGITMNRDRLLADAKQRVLAMVPTYSPPEPVIYNLSGSSAYSALDMAVNTLYLAGKATAYDKEISRQLAFVISGGSTDITQSLTEQNLLDLEREAFVKLVQQPGTLARLEHMLKTGKALRN